MANDGEARTAPGGASGGPVVAAVFGTFYPNFQFGGNFTTGLVKVLSDLPQVRKVVVYCPYDSALPEAFDPQKVELRRVWDHDNPLSLVRALGEMVRSAPSFDVTIFNTYVTAFGRGRISNALGLLLPTVLSKLTGRPIVTYLHNLVETQDVEGLGYSPSWFTRRVARLLEAALLRATQVVVPLESQRAVIREGFGREVSNLYVPYLEVVLSLTSMTSHLSSLRTPPPNGGARLLLLGSWGPQKDLSGISTVVRDLVEEGIVGPRVLAGPVNPQFPSAQQAIDETVSRLTGPGFCRIPLVSEEEILPLLMAHDVLVLPYRASGGYSGALNCAALTDISVVASDLPQLREQAELLDYPVRFIPPGNGLTLSDTIRSACTTAVAARRRPDLGEMQARLERTRGQVRRLLELRARRPTPLRSS